MSQEPSPSPLASEPLAFVGLPELSDRVFYSYRRLIYQEAGIYLGPHKKALLMGRLSRRLRELGISFGAYLHQVEEDAIERARMLEAICTHETRFFREPRHFDFLEREVLPRWVSQGGTDSGGKQVRIWSAGCSSGEEAFSLAMVLRYHLPAEEGWTIEILATDLSTRILERARQTLWPLDRATEIPTRYLKAFMLRGTGSQEGVMKAGPELRPLVQFQRVNLNEESLPVLGRFDLLFCRNVFIYFDAASKARAVDRLVGRLASKGYFFVGHAESLGAVTHRLQLVQPTIYTLVAAD
ncbi:CheR family methyltransferase [Hyalangium minutum]|uniref:protein-glutamate O-methyltransferase n=1 Tax=Hyalangium minutum TaxID=394096 RepID=A0A085WP49_9BACT|nr:protein-glutamate O-methyltransferase CheR [Hyalangium minutum]KFE69462.1 Chemotaxis protein methyltransferase CheR [Hyalangium minutum]